MRIEKVPQRLASGFMRDYSQRELIRGNTMSNLILYFVLAYALCATSYQIGSGAAASFPRRLPNETTTLPPLRDMFDWTRLPQFWHSVARATSTLYCRFHVNHEHKCEKPDTTQRRMGHGRNDQEHVLEGTYTSDYESSQRALYPSHALRTADSIKVNEVHVPVHISALSKMLQKPLDGQVEVTDAQLEQLQQGDIDLVFSFEEQHPRSWMYNPLLRGSARNNRKDYSTETLIKGSYITANPVQSNYNNDRGHLGRGEQLEIHDYAKLNREAMHHTQEFRPLLAHAVGNPRIPYMENNNVFHTGALMDHYSKDAQMENDSLDSRSEVRKQIPFGTRDLTHSRSRMSGIPFGIQGTTTTTIDRGHLGRGVHNNSTTILYHDIIHSRSRVKGIPFGVLFGILEIFDNVINFVHKCCVLVPTTTSNSLDDVYYYYHNGTDQPRRRLFTDSTVESSVQLQLEIPPTMTTTTVMPMPTVNHLHIFVNLLTFASVLAILVIVCHMYPGAPSGGSDATVKTPPSWGPEQERRYPFKKYTKDLLLWLMATDVPQERHCATIVLRLTGAAKELAEELTPQQLQNGGLIPALDNFGNPTTEQVNAVTFLMHQLNARFGPLDEEIRLKAVHEWNNFRRRPGETISATLTRFEQISSEPNMMLESSNLTRPLRTNYYKFLDSARKTSSNTSSRLVTECLLLVMNTTGCAWIFDDNYD